MLSQERGDSRQCTARSDSVEVERFDTRQSCENAGDADAFLMQDEYAFARSYCERALNGSRWIVREEYGNHRSGVADTAQNLL